MKSPLSLAALLLALALPAAGADWKRIRVGVEGGYPPFSSVATDGSLQGFDIDILSGCGRGRSQRTGTGAQQTGNALPLRGDAGIEEPAGVYGIATRIFGARETLLHGGHLIG